MKKILAFITVFFAVSFTAVAGQADDLVAYANSFIGSPYRSGGTGPRAFDCSGFTSFVYAHFGYKLNHNSAAQVSDGRAVKRKNVQKGDLIFFKGANASSNRVGHVGIVVSEKGETPIRFVHASTSAGVRIDDAESDYYNRRYVCICRVLSDDYSIENDENFVPETSEDIPSDTLTQSETIVPQSQPSAPQPQTYVVKKGDTMYALSRRFGCTVKQLQTANGMTGCNLSVGQTLQLPDNRESVQNFPVEKNIAVDSVKVEPQLVSEMIIHIVKKGETLYRISRQYGCTPENLRQWNNLQGNLISVGQHLKVKK